MGSTDMVRKRVTGIKDSGWESGIYWVAGVNRGKPKGGEHLHGRIALIEVSFPTRWDFTLITLCRSHHHGGSAIIRGKRKTDRAWKEREKETKANEDWGKPKDKSGTEKNIRVHEIQYRKNNYTNKARGKNNVLGGIILNLMLNDCHI